MRIVKVPTLPTNMLAAKISLPESLSCGVIPKLNPTVLNAEKLSKARSVKFILRSVMLKPNTVNPSANRDRKIIAEALLIESIPISLPKASTLSWPFVRLKKFRIPTANVEVFIPPPVEPGDAPIHIRNIINIIAGKDKSPMSIELKPAVRGLAPIKNAPANLPQNPVCTLNDLSYSNAKMPTVPITSKITVVQATNLALKVITQALYIKAFLKNNLL